MPRSFTLVTLLLAGPALAQDTPSVAIVGLHQADLSVSDQREASEIFAQAVEDAGFFDARRPKWVADRLRGREPLVLRDAFGGAGRSRLEEGRTLYGQAQMDQAVSALEESVEILGQGLALTRSPRELWDALIYLGAARQAAGDYRGGRTAFEQAIAVMPLRTPSTQEFPPDLIQRYDDLRRERQALATSVRVTAGDTGTVIWLNGERQGSTPLTVEDVIPGRNYFYGESPLGFSGFEIADVQEARQGDVTVRLDTPMLANPASSETGRSRQISDLYAALGESLEVDMILVAGTAEGEATAQLYSTRTDTWTDTVSTRYVGSSADELSDVLPTLWVNVREDGTFEPSARVAAPRGLDVSGDVLLSRILLLPEQDAFADERTEKKPKKVGKILLGVGIGLAVAGGVTWGTAYALTEPFQGRVGFSQP